MTSIINWGILAPGRIARKFATDLSLVKNARLHAVASRSLERAKAFADEFGASHAYGSYEEIIDCPDLDVVYVASPHTGHFEHGLLLLKNKVPVLCEKPLSINSRQVQEMIHTARENNTFLMEAIWTRFIPLFEEVLRMVATGQIGTLNSIRADFGFKAKFDPEHRLFNRSLGGGSLLDVGIYPVFLATLLFGKPKQIKASALKGKTGSDDSCAMVFDFDEKKMAVLDCSVINHTRTIGVLYGDKGKIQIHGRFHESERASLSIYGEKSKEIYLPKTGIGYYHEILAVNECLRNGEKECSKLPLDFSALLMENLDETRKEAGIIYPGIDK